MLSSANRRISILERSIQLPMTAERFAALVEDHMRLTGVNFEEAMDTVMRPFSIEKLDSLIDQLLDIAFGANSSAKDEWRRNEEMRAANEPNVQPAVDRPSAE
jgi:hypothetical protein